ncbi:MAG: hypothetical protein KDC12_14480 [Flavobacteriales bacterium]|nr:hypothetical protein [Flavobacteriales bacterium]
MESRSIVRRSWSRVLFVVMLCLTCLGLLSTHFSASSGITILRHSPNGALPDFPFLRYDLNRLDYYGDSTHFNRFYNMLDELIFTGNGEIDILHMGGSHVQAGVLSNRLREDFFSLSENLQGARGFLFPFRLAHTNSPFNLKADYTGEWEGCKNSHNKHQCNWGLAGYTATTLDSAATIKLWSFNSDSINYPFTIVKVYYDMSPQSYEVCLDSGLTALREERDSLENCVTYYLDQAYDTLRLEILKTDSLQDHFSLQGIFLDDHIDKGISYHAVGVNGASVPSYLRCGLLGAQLRSIQPDLVIFGIGINDAYMSTGSFRQSTFEANYDSLIQQILAVNPNANFLFLTNNDSYYKRRHANRNALGVQTGMINLATKYNGAVWDLFEIMGGLNSISTWEQAGLAKKDKIHFTPEGYILEADLLFMAIRKAYGDYLERN